MRRGFGLIGLVVTAMVLVIVGVIAYNIGWSDGLNTHLPAAANGTTAGAGPYYYDGYGPHWGGPGFGIFPILGFFWFLFVLFVIFALIRFAFFGRLWRGGGGGWGKGPGSGGYGGPGQGHGIPPVIEERMKEWHRQAHGDAPSTPGSGTTPPPPPPDSRSV
jgi:hypothetical protein